MVSPRPLEEEPLALEPFELSRPRTTIDGNMGWVASIVHEPTSAFSGLSRSAVGEGIGGSVNCGRPETSTASASRTQANSAQALHTVSAAIRSPTRKPRAGGAEPVNGADELVAGLRAATTLRSAAIQDTTAATVPRRIKMWFASLLALGLLGFGVVAMIAYVVAGPRRHEAERGTSWHRGSCRHLKTAGKKQQS
jgi:cobalamin biosynthesis Mg chelatase CobN